MSHEIVKSIQFKDNKVYLTSAANNVSPITFSQWECTAFSKIYQEQGRHAALEAICSDVWNGNIHLRSSGSKLCKLIDQSFSFIRSTALRNFLDEGRGAAFLANTTEKLMDNTGYVPLQELFELNALRNTRETVLEVCTKNPEAFLYASPAIQQDREAAQKYVDKCSDMLMFRFPVYFKEDKELALAALPQNGCIFRDLGPGLRGDPDIVRLAFRADMDRKFFEHLPDLISPSLRSDPAFIRELISICPSIHMFRTPELLNDRETALHWSKNGKFFPYSANELPPKYLPDPEFQNVFLERFGNDEKCMSTLQQAYEKRGLTFPSLSKGIDLNSKLQDAQARSAAQSNQSPENREVEAHTPDPER